jgi:hypothetical protein
LTTYEYPIFDNTIPKIKIKKIKMMKTEGGDLKDDEEAHPTEQQKYTQIKPKYKVNDLVNVLLEEPQTILGKKQPTKNFRMGDLRLEKKKRKVIKVLYYSGPQKYRYLIEGLPNASFVESELKQV